jgi:hypothetical protein
VQSNAHEICYPFPPSLSPLLQAQNIASPKWPPTTYALGLPNTVACAASLHGPLQLQIWTPFPLPAPFFLTVARQSATNIFSHNLLSISRVHSKIIFHLHASGTISRSFLGSTLPSLLFCLSPSPPQAGCRRYNLSKVALSSTVRSLPTCLVETRTCLSRMTNLPISGPLSIPVSTVSNWRREVPQRNTMPFLMTQFQKVPKCSILTTCLLFLNLSFCFEGDLSTCLGRALLLAQRVLLLQGDSPARPGCALLLGAAALCETTIQEFEQKLICFSPCFLTPPNGTSPLRLAVTG